MVHCGSMFAIRGELHAFGGTMTALPPPPAAPTSATPCRFCGAYQLHPKHKELTRKRRSKFGVLWLLATILTGGLGLLVYLVWPRHNEVVSVDRWVECGHCGARQV